jgi:hypothetical protein
MERRSFTQMDHSIWKEFRQGVYGSFERGEDALFNLSDALLSEVQAQSLAELSLSPFFERKWPSVYEGLQDGEINVEQLRKVIVSTLMGQWEEGKIVWTGVDGTIIERAEAETSEDRGYLHLPNLPLVDKPISVGWQWSNVVLLPEIPSSWTPPLESRRIPTKKTAVEVAIEQLRELRPLFGDRRVGVIADRGYATPEFLRACRDLGYVCLVRLKTDRTLYRVGKRLHARGPVPKDGALFQGKRKETHGEPDAAVSALDAKGRTVQITRFEKLHFKQDRELEVQVICVERQAAKGSKRDPKLSCYVTLDNSIPLQEIPTHYARRFSQEHGYRFSKQDLLWTSAHVRTPEQFERWSWLVAIVMVQLFLARELGQALYRPWESKDRPLTPAQVRRVMPVLLTLLGTPARPCRPRGVSPGRPKGFRPQPAPRFSVVRKHPKKGKKDANVSKTSGKAPPPLKASA